MKPYWEHPAVTLFEGDCREVLRALPAESVQCIVTSPPYWSLRDYGIAPEIWGADMLCLSPEEHRWETEPTAEGFTGTTRWQHTTNGRGEEQPDEKRLRTTTTRETRPEAWGQVGRGDTCQRCGAWRGCLGLEPTPALFVEHIVEVFRDVRRVLRPDGTLWLNLGDSYAGSWGAQGHRDSTTNGQVISRNQIDNHPKFARNTGSLSDGLKPKDLVGIPWRVAFALQADGWWLRQDIIWAKPNSMPESVTDRCTKAHEYLFLLTKSERYYYDAKAIEEAANYPKGAGNTHAYEVPGQRNGENANLGGSIHLVGPRGTRNKRSVWTIPTAPLAEAHFATFPPDLVRPCVLAGSRPDDVVLDPFVGSGTVAMVARDLGRKAIVIDASPKYLAMAVRRIGGNMALPLTT